MLPTERIPEGRLRQHRMSLCEWLSPKAFHDALETISPSSEQFFNSGALNYFRDAYVADIVASSLMAEHVRLLQLDPWPDFETKIAGQIIGWEMTEADVPGRRRGDEYRQAAEYERRTGRPHMEHDPVQRWRERADLIPDAIEQAVGLKVSKRYSAVAARQMRLVIMLNIQEYDIAQREVEDCMIDRTSSGRYAFGEVWIVWKDRLYRLWAHGEPVGEVTPRHRW